MAETQELFLCGVTHVEIHSALARMTLDKRLDQRDLNRRLNSFEALWTQAQIVLITPTVLETASALALKHQLRGYDAVQLAALQEISSLEILFGCFDQELSKAAAVEGYELLV